MLISILYAGSFFPYPTHITLIARKDTGQKVILLHDDHALGSEQENSALSNHIYEKIAAHAYDGKEIAIVLEKSKNYTRFGLVDTIDRSKYTLSYSDSPYHTFINILPKHVQEAYSRNKLPSNVSLFSADPRYEFNKYLNTNNKDNFPYIKLRKKWGTMLNKIPLVLDLFPKNIRLALSYKHTLFHTKEHESMLRIEYLVNIGTPIENHLYNQWKNHLIKSASYITSVIMLQTFFTYRNIDTFIYGIGGAHAQDIIQLLMLDENFKVGPTQQFSRALFDEYLQKNQ